MSEHVASALDGITPDVVVAATRLVRKGQVISLNLPLDGPTPTTRPRLRRTLRLHNQLRPLGDGRFVVLNDDIVELATQGSSQWDTFAHCGLIAPDRAGVFLGGVGLEETQPGGMPPRLGLGAFGAGVVTRGVLIDTVALLRSEVGHLEETDRVGRADVEECLARQGTELHRGDVVFLYTGFGRRYSMSDEAMPKVAGGIDSSTMPLWRDAGVAALISDNIAVEASPANFDVHIACLVEFGIPLGELWALEELAAACREDGVYEFLLVSVPINLPYAFGSPANAVAIR